MTSNQNADSDDAQQSTGPMERHDVTIEMLQKPGILFEAGDCCFLTTGGPGGTNVIRLASGTNDELDSTLLEEDIENGEVDILRTHSVHTEVAVNRTVLATLVDYVADDVENMPGPVSDAQEAVEKARERLD